jgi:hypothetical protein
MRLPSSLPATAPIVAVHSGPSSGLTTRHIQPGPSEAPQRTSLAQPIMMAVTGLAQVHRCTAPAKAAASRALPACPRPAQPFRGVPRSQPRNLTALRAAMVGPRRLRARHRARATLSPSPPATGVQPCVAARPRQARSCMRIRCDSVVLRPAPPLAPRLGRGAALAPGGARRGMFAQSPRRFAAGRRSRPPERRGRATARRRSHPARAPAAAARRRRAAAGCCGNSNCARRGSSRPPRTHRSDAPPPAAPQVERDAPTQSFESMLDEETDEMEFEEGSEFYDEPAPEAAVSAPHGARSASGRGSPAPT